MDSVRDGDTILLADGRRVRLVQVDAPELGVECWGDEAADALERLAPRGTELRLERDPGLDDVDRYGRLLRYAYAGSATSRSSSCAPAPPLRTSTAASAGSTRGAWSPPRTRPERSGAGSGAPAPTARLRPERQVATGPG